MLGVMFFYSKLLAMVVGAGVLVYVLVASRRRTAPCARRPKEQIVCSGKQQSFLIEKPCAVFAPSRPSGREHGRRTRWMKPAGRHHQRPGRSGKG